MRQITYGKVYAEATKTLQALNRGSARIFVDAAGGRTACVEPGAHYTTVHLPSIPADTLISEADADMYLGYAIHELCHIFYSRLDALAGLDPDLSALTNALEDARIESLEIERGQHRGVRGLLSSLADRLARRSGVPAWSKIPPARQLAWAAALGCRAASGHYADAPSLLEVVSSIPADTAHLVATATARLPSCRSSDDVIALARDLLQQQQRGDDGKGGGDGDDGDDGKGGGGGDDGDDGKGGGDDGDGDDGKGGGDDGDGDDGKGGGDPEAILDVGDMVAGDAAAMGACGTSTPQAHAQDQLLRIIAVVGGHQSAPWPHTRPAGPWSALLPRPAKLRDQLRRMLRATETVAVVRREQSGRLDPRAIMRAQWGDLDVYTRRTRTDGVETDVLILLDLSGSMTDPTSVSFQGRRACRLDVAKAFGLSLGDAITNAGGSVKIVGFASTNQGSGGSWLVAKDWRDRGGAWREHVAGMDPFGGTRIVEEIIAGAVELEARGAQRRLILVLTDGECETGAPTVMAACNHVRRAHGVEVGGIGCDNDVSGAFPTCQTVFDLAEIAERGLDVLVAALEKAARR